MTLSWIPLVRRASLYLQYRVPTVKYHLALDKWPIKPRLSKSLQSPPKNRNVFRLRGSPTLKAGRMHFVGFASLQRPYNVPPRSLAVNVAITTFLINANTTRGAGQPGETVGWRGAARRGDGDADLVPYAQECCPDGSLAPSLSRCRHLHGYTPRPACLLAPSTLHSTPLLQSVRRPVLR